MSTLSQACHWCTKPGATYWQQEEGETVWAHKRCGPHTVPEEVERRVNEEARKIYDNWKARCAYCGKTSFSWHHNEDLAECLGGLNRAFLASERLAEAIDNEEIRRLLCPDFLLPLETAEAINALKAALRAYDKAKGE